LSSATNPASSRRGLGRGLEVLIGGAPATELAQLPLDHVHPNPRQPRRRFDHEATAALAESVRAQGLVQPIVVRSRAAGGFELIAGERRWRAAERLGWSKIPAVVKDVDDQTLLTLALVENLQRNDLSPIDEASGYRRLGEEFQLPYAEIARMVGRNRSTIANLLRLLQLSSEIQSLVHEGKLSEGHARALLGVSDQARALRLAQEAVTQGWSVREMEARVKEKRSSVPAQPPRGISGDTKRVEDALRKRLGTDVRVTARRRGRGFLTISYYSNDDLARLLELILGGPFEG
jgi:ParB family chromosome partitioning protein